MMTRKKFRIFLRNLPLKVRKKSSGGTGWKAELLRYGNTAQEVRPGKNKLCILRKYLAPLIEKAGAHSRRQASFTRKQTRKNLLRKTWRWGFAVLLLAVAGLLLRQPAGDLLVSLDFFRIKDVSIEGYGITEPEEIRLYGGIDYSMSMFTATEEKLSEKIADHPWISSAQVDKVWPDGVHIVVREHHTAALMLVGPADEAKLYYMNAAGEPIAAVAGGDDLDYPVISGLNTFSEKKREDALAEAVLFLRLVSANDPNLPAQSVSEIHFDPQQGMVVRLVDFPFPIYFGSGEVKKKYRRLRSVLAVLYKKRSTTMDISEVKYIHMEYYGDKVLVAQSKSG